MSLAGCSVEARGEEKREAEPEGRSITRAKMGGTVFFKGIS